MDYTKMSTIPSLRDAYRKLLKNTKVKNYISKVTLSAQVRGLGSR